MSTDRPGALAGLRVVGLSRVLGGPYCTQILADHGADVVKIEPPEGDETRGWGPPFVDGTAAYFLAINRNKHGARLDLKSDEGRAMLLALLEGADVLVKNFKPGTLDRWGLSEASLAERFPGLVHCRISGFGADGPLGGMPGYDAAIQAMVGLMSVNGEPDGNPTRVGVPIVDMVTGLNATIGILLALQERARSGRGQFVEAALFDCGLSVLHPHATNFFASGRTPGRSGNAHPNIAPYSAFRTGEGSIFLAVGNDGQFRKLCEALGAPDLAVDPRYGSNSSRLSHHEALEAALEELLVGHEAVPLPERLIKEGVPCGPILTVPQALEHEQTYARGMIVEMAGYKGIASPIKLSRTPATYRMPPPAFDDHDASLAGLSPSTAVGPPTS